LEIDRKIQETSHSLSNLSSNKNRESVLLLLDEAVEADRKVKILTQRLTELKSEEIETQYQILQHTAGVLCLGLQKMESTPKTSTPPISPQTKRSTSSLSHQQKLQDLKSEFETITHTLKNMLKRYDLKSNVSQTLSATQLLDRLETQLDNYKSESNQLESKLRSAEERHRLESMSEKKLQFQLRAAREKNLNMQQEIDTMHAKNKLDWLPPLQQDSFDFADDSQIRIGELETELIMTKENQQRVEQELQKGYAEIAQLQATVTEMEIQSSKIQSQVAVFQSREDALKSEMEQYRDQVSKFRTDKEQWERTMKRRTVMQVLNNENNVNPAELEAKYEQQLEEQEQEYQAQLKEQAAFLDKTTRQCEQLRQEHDKLSATCRDLEILIRDKQKALDARDVQVSKLQSELLLQQQQQQKLTAVPATHPNEESLQQLQALFSEKETAWIEQSSAMEANFEGILKEFDRLTGTAMEFETDRRNYEKRIEKLTQEVQDLETSLTEEKSKNLGYEADTPTTASLRKEFRKMINDMKADHQRTLEREAEEKKRLEKQLKDLKHEREMSRYERMNKGVQTLFFA
jgi:chromosome segregation ATPase